MKHVIAPISTNVLHGCATLVGATGCVNMMFSFCVKNCTHVISI
jgi:hypothetical protein